MDSLPSCLGRWEELVVSQKLSKYFTMNWTAGQLHRSCHSRLRKTNSARQRQKEKEHTDKRPSSISFLRSISSSSRRSRASHDPGSSPNHHSSHFLSATRADHSKKQPNAPATSEEQPLLPTIRGFLAEQAAAVTSGSLGNPAQYDEQALERMRKRLLVKKDWGTARVLELTSASLKRPRLSLQNENLAGDACDARKRLARLPKYVQDRKHEVQARALHRHDMKIRIGSRERRLGESSTINRSSATHPVTEMRDLLTDQVPLPRDLSDSWRLDAPRQGNKLHPSTLPMRNTVAGGEYEDSLPSNCALQHFLGSPPTIFQPVPLRAIPAHMYSIDTLESANTNSTLAQVGQIISPIPASQKAENATWMDWLEHPTSDISNDEADDGSREPLEGLRVSPGVRERYRTVREPSQELPVWGNVTLAKDVIGVSSGEPPGISKPSSSSDCSRILSQYEDLISKIGQPQEHPELDVSQCQPSPDKSSNDEEGGSIHADAICPESPKDLRQADRDPSEADLDKAWKMFVFGDENTDEVEEEAFSEAKHDAARDLQPCDCSTCVTPKPLSDLGGLSNIAAAGTMYSHDNHGGLSEVSDELLSDSSASASRKATPEPWPTGKASDPTSGGADMALQPQSIWADAGSSTPEIEDHTVNDPDDNNLAPTETEFIESIIPEAPTSPAFKTASVATSMVVEAARSEAGPREPHFRFARPKPFVGNRSVPAHLKRPAETVAPFITLTKRTSRLRRRARDGRADIRALPNYSDDPIEDIENDDDPPPPSLFGALELV
ncbi:hypothetical protein B0H67DRAFT_577443 [Lasiosphaeris hirsuta]|uniref:Uncharacterized protein n=1 Tax=Lasiosphaeris hirsuta TaxID=260670 RepID=A0AA40ARU2_9PEZI|nr:hypothetical protein B0H67DRAFT_577443 [Lasiosphaeris hirsuta]